jgi:hypothetical protein
MHRDVRRGAADAVNRVPFQDTDRAKLTMVFLGLAHEHWVAIRSLAVLGLHHQQKRGSR